MTKSTDSKNINKMVKSILTSKGIDNLELEIDLAHAFMRYLNDRQSGESPAVARERITTEYGALGFIGVSGVAMGRARITQKLMDALRLNVDDGLAWERVVTFCLNQEKAGRTVERYQAWREKDIYNAPRAHQIAQNPSLIITTWPQAFYEKEKTDQPEYKKYIPEDEGKYTPAPKRIK